MLLETNFLIALLITLIIEIVVIFLLLKTIFKSKLKNFKIFFAGFVASTLTLPYLWFILPSFVDMRYYILTGELLVIFVETIIYKEILGLNIKRAFLISFVANLTSFILGLLIF
jgi:hypothetical protein